MRESQRNQTAVQPQTLEAVEYVFIFTTLGGDYSVERVLEIYRARWQIELTFKRLKSLVSLGHVWGCAIEESRTQPMQMAGDLPHA